MAKPYWGNAEQKSTIIFTIRIHKNYIDWETTDYIGAQSHLGGLQENEIRLLTGTSLNIIGIELNGKPIDISELGNRQFYANNSLMKFEEDYDEWIEENNPELTKEVISGKVYYAGPQGGMLWEKDLPTWMDAKNMWMGVGKYEKPGKRKRVPKQKQDWRQITHLYKNLGGQLGPTKKRRPWDEGHTKTRGVPLKKKSNRYYSSIDSNLLNEANRNILNSIMQDLDNILLWED
jgi:hypothetical protein